jgi:hypothetical protein
MKLLPLRDATGSVTDYTKVLPRIAANGSVTGDHFKRRPHNKETFNFLFCLHQTMKMIFKFSPHKPKSPEESIFRSTSNSNLKSQRILPFENTLRKKVT